MKPMQAPMSCRRHNLCQTAGARGVACAHLVRMKVQPVGVQEAVRVPGLDQGVVHFPLNLEHCKQGEGGLRQTSHRMWQPA